MAVASAWCDDGDFFGFGVGVDAGDFFGFGVVDAGDFFDFAMVAGVVVVDSIGFVVTVATVVVAGTCSLTVCDFLCFVVVDGT